MIKKQAVLYMEPKFLRKEATCAGCIFFIQDTEQCMLLDPEHVTANQGCGLYVGGEPTDSAHAKPLRLISAEVAGLDTGPFTCKRCEYFDITSLKSGRFQCGKGVGDFEGDTVHINGCCDAWDDE